MERFEYIGKDFYADGKKTLIVSGAMHYFRIPQEYWFDRLLKLKECGFNCVETYLAWNLHEEKEGRFDFSARLDFGEFLDIAHELGLMAIVRPGPYICAEWEGGGLPAWLFKEDNIRVRCNDEKYLYYAKRYLKQVFERVRPRLVKNGGNVIMMQVENEYGSFGNDSAYVNELAKFHEENGMDCLLFTSDGALPSAYYGGRAEGCLPFFNFGSRVEEQMSIYDKLDLKTPRVCAEFWAGWFDHWGGEHHVRPEREIVECLQTFLEKGYGFNMYMFHGGTNFGFMNGCNYGESKGIMPTVTSYDYCAPLNEAGDRTPTYYAIRDLFIRYGLEVPPLTATDSPKRGYGRVEFTGAKGLFSAKGEIGFAQNSLLPMTMEQCGQNYGYILYTTDIYDDLHDYELFLDKVGDRAIVYINGEKQGVYQDKKTDNKLVINTPKGKKCKLSVLVENEGRVNYGYRIYDSKGLTGMRLYNQFLHGIENWSLPMNDLENVTFEPLKDLTEYKEQPTFFKGRFFVDTPCDTFLRTDGFRKGFAVVNGFNLGRFNEQGPQKTLYVPAPLLREGENELIIFDSDGIKELHAELVACHQLS